MIITNELRSFTHLFELKLALINEVSFHITMAMTLCLYHGVRLYVGSRRSIKHLLRLFITIATSNILSVNLHN